MKLYATVAAWLGGLQLPFVRRSKVAAILAELAQAERDLQMLRKVNDGAKLVMEDDRNGRRKAQDEVERLRALVVQLDTAAARRESEITRLKDRLDRFSRMIDDVRTAIGGHTLSELIIPIKLDRPQKAKP
jgi:chromosome segregation ATPase